MEPSGCAVEGALEVAFVKAVVARLELMVARLELIVARAEAMVAILVLMEVKFELMMAVGVP